MSTEEPEDRIYTTYYADVGKHKTLTLAEERELFRRYHTCPLCDNKFLLEVLRENCPKCGLIISMSEIGKPVCHNCDTKLEAFETPKYCRLCGSPRDNEARDVIIESNLRFVVREARKMCTEPAKLNALISAGNTGLIIAVDKYNPNRGTRFLTYAAWWIRKEMFDAINASPLVHVPAFQRKILIKASKEGKYVCEYCDLRTNTTINTVLPICPQGEHSFIDTVFTKHNVLVGQPVAIDALNISGVEQPEENFIDDTMKATLRRVLRKSPLTPRGLYIIMGYFNAAQPDRKSEEKNLNQLSAILGVTPERVRQLKTRALQKIKRKLSGLDVRESKDMG